MHRGSVMAQKRADEFHRPERTIHTHMVMLDTVSGPMRGAATADLKHCAKGQSSTFTAAMCYATEYQQRRDELMAKFAAQNEAAAEE